MALPTETTFSQEYLNEYDGYRALACAGTFIGILVFCFGLRIVARWLRKTPLSWDDWLMVPALFSIIALCGVTIAMVKRAGVGHHVQSLSDTQILLLTKLEVVFTVVYVLAITFPKIAIICLFLRVFIAKIHRKICFILIAIMVSNLIALTLVTCLECIPLRKLWEPTIDGHCINITAFWRWSTISNIITDVVMLTLPIPIIWQLQVSTKDKVGISLTLCTGGIGLIASILRFTIFFENAAGGDISWTAAELAIYSMAEPTIYFLTACLPVYRSLFSAIRQRTLSGTSILRSKTYTNKSREIQLSNMPAAQKNRYANLEDFTTDEKQLTVIEAMPKYFSSSDKLAEDAKLRYTEDLQINQTPIHVTREFRITRDSTS